MYLENNLGLIAAIVPLSVCAALLFGLLLDTMSLHEEIAITSVNISSTSAKIKALEVLLSNLELAQRAGFDQIGQFSTVSISLFLFYQILIIALLQYCIIWPEKVEDFFNSFFDERSTYFFVKMKIRAIRNFFHKIFSFFSGIFSIFRRP
jgi:hypothetical protein